MFSQTAEYALRAMTMLAELDPNGPSATAERISAVTRVPRSYLSKVMRDLARAGLVDSQRGPNGGFVLGRPAEQITILQVLAAVDPIHRITSCPLGRPDHVKLCPLHRRLDAAIAQVEGVLGRTTLGELVTQGTKGCPMMDPTPAVAPFRRGKLG
jgi:Rrf2 family protein